MLSYHRFITVVASLLVCCHSMGSEPTGLNNNRASQPNVLLILADDLGIRDLGVEGSQFYESPNIDQLANRSSRFTRAYAGCQVCSPSRATILTGTSPVQHGITDWIGAASGTKWNRNDRVLPAEYNRHLPHEFLTIPELLADAGYATFFAGKWHLGDTGSSPEDHGFQSNQGGYWSGSPKGGYFSPYNNPTLSDGPPGESLPIRLAEETSQFITQHRDQPFFAMLSFYSVHAPIETSQSRWKYFREKSVKMASDKKNIVGQASNQEDSVQGNVPVSDSSAERFKIDRTLPVRQVQDHPVYAGVVAEMDQAVGNVLATLKQMGLTENTIVIFTSDNGGVSSGDAYCTSNLPYRGGKGRQWEGGLRVPFYLSAPMLNQSLVVDQPATHADILPTVADLLKIPVECSQTIEGVSLVPAMQGKELSERALYWHYPHYGNQGGEPSAVWMEGDWKLIHYFEDGRNELYDLSNDIGETNDVSSAHRERTKNMFAALDDKLNEFEAVRPAADSRFDSNTATERRQSIQTQLLPRLERQHAAVLRPDYQPNMDWWGSSKE